MFFSVVIPTYNRGTLILKTLESVYNQKFEDYEVLVVDNCSTDGTKEVLKPLIDSGKLKFIQHDQNYERSKSRNTGMINAKGKYVTFLDSDDLMGETCLLDAYNYLTQIESVDFLFNRFQFLDKNGLKVPFYQEKIQLSDAFKEILIGNFLACIGVFISEKVYKKYRFYEDKEIIGSEDWLFWIEILHNEKSIGMIDKINSSIVDHEDRTVRKFNPEALEKRVEFIRNILVNKLKVTSKYLNIYDWSSLILVANGYFEAGNKSKSIEILKKAIVKYPSLILKVRTLVLIKNLIFRKL